VKRPLGLLWRYPRHGVVTNSLLTSNTSLGTLRPNSSAEEHNEQSCKVEEGKPSVSLTLSCQSLQLPHNTFAIRALARLPPSHPSRVCWQENSVQMPNAPLDLPFKLAQGKETPTSLQPTCRSPSAATTCSTLCTCGVYQGMVGQDLHDISALVLACMQYPCTWCLHVLLVVGPAHPAPCTRICVTERSFAWLWGLHASVASLAGAMQQELGARCGICSTIEWWNIHKDFLLHQLVGHPTHV
jgi:hypothetical protein